jgi:ribosomal protein S16
MLTVKFHKSAHGKNKLFYSIIIITKKASPYSGKLNEEIGHYHPIKNK